MIAVVVRRGAETDVADAQKWYSREDHHLGISFVEEFARTVERIRARPDQFPEVSRDVRRALLYRFPYATYFVRRVDSAIVVAVLHQRRRPDAWRARAREERGALTSRWSLSRADQRTEEWLRPSSA